MMLDKIITIKDEKELEKILSTPSPEVIKFLSDLEGDIIILGVGGKLGPSLARMAKRALEEGGKSRRIIGVSRFTSEKDLKYLKTQGIETFRGDLLDRKFIENLPLIENVFYLVGMKFGSTENLPLTWIVNSIIPALIAEKYRNSRIVALSTGNVYPFVKINEACTEFDKPDPVGEYAQSCLGRERVFQYFSQQNGTPISLIRLNYAVEMRYGVLVDIATKVISEMPIDLTVGYVNVIWQGDANAIILQSLSLCQAPANILNVTGPEIISVRWVAEQFGKIFRKEPRFIEEEGDTALLSNAAKAFQHFGYPRVSLEKMIEWIADWIINNRPLYNKPTHFEIRNGKY